MSSSTSIHYARGSTPRVASHGSKPFPSPHPEHGGARGSLPAAAAVAPESPDSTPPPLQPIPTPPLSLARFLRPGDCRDEAEGLGANKGGPDPMGMRTGDDGGLSAGVLGDAVDVLKPDHGATTQVQATPQDARLQPTSHLSPKLRKSPPPRVIPASNLTAGRMGQRAKVLQSWAEFCRHVQNWADPKVANCAVFKEDTPFQPANEQEVQALENLVSVANQHARQENGKPFRPPERLDQLLEIIRKNVPGSVVRGQTLRFAQVLRALIEQGITPGQLDFACKMGVIRDVGAQVTVSMGGYTSSFFTFNALLAKFVRDREAPSTIALAPPAAHAVANLSMQRFLRTAEMYPGWTRAVELDGDGAVAPAITTPAGFVKTMVQYWPFFVPLFYISLATLDAADAQDDATKIERNAARIELRQMWGFAATLFVALHRMTVFNRDPVWLDASTPTRRQAMLGAIAELAGSGNSTAMQVFTGLGNSATALLKYVAVRPVAGLVGLAGLDIHTPLNEAWEKVVHVRPDSKQAHPWPKSAGVSGSLQEKTLTAFRASLLFFPMLVFSAFRAIYNDQPRYSDLVNVASDVLLVGLWGAAMAYSEQLMAPKDPNKPQDGRCSASNEGMSTENKARAERHLVSLARRAGPPPPPDDVAPASDMFDSPA